MKKEIATTHIGHTVPGSFAGYCPACQASRKPKPSSKKQLAIFAAAIGASLLVSTSVSTSAFASSDTTVPQTLTAWSDQSDSQEAIYVQMPDDVCNISLSRDVVKFTLCDDNWDTSQVVPPAQTSSAAPQPVATPQSVSAATPKASPTPKPTQPKNCDPVQVSGYTNSHGTYVQPTTRKHPGC